jgi:Na+-transporting NADH:ubiquinone oxidoreductase subunit E
MNLLELFIKSVFIDNMVFSFFFGMCSYIAVSKSVKTANGLGLAVTFVMLMTVPLNYLLENYVLKAGALKWISPALEGVDLSFLSFILFIAVIAAFVQLLEMFIEKFSPSLYNQLGIFLPLIAVNCAIMGGALFMQQRAFATVGEAAVFGFGSGFGWWIAILVMAAIRERLSYSNVPKGLRGPGLAFIITGLLGMAFMIFSGFQM